MQRLDRAFEQLLAFVFAFIFSGLALIFALALIETFTPLHVPLGPARTALAWAIGCAALAMGLRSAARARRRAAATADLPQAHGQQAGTGRRSQQRASDQHRSAEAERLRLQAEAEIAEALRIKGERTKPVDPTTAAAIEAARWRPIVFRETFPPPADPGLSFYGGAPIGPRGMNWPAGKDGTPLTFIMQWDCAALARLDVAQLLPKSGALYLFGTLNWGDAMDFRFFHQSGGETEWEPLALPAGLPPAFGKGASYSSPMVSNKMPVDLQDAPRLLPRWPFVPVAIEYPHVELDEEDALFWSEKIMAEKLVYAQDETGALTPEPGIHRREGRPFPGFPHDWAAVRIVAAQALDSLGRIDEWQWRKIAPEADAASRVILMDEWRAEAQALYGRAVGHSAGQAVPQGEVEQLWQRLEPLARLIFTWSGTVETSINASLGLASDGLAAVPASEIESCANMHMLGRAYMRREYEREFQARLDLDGPIKAAETKARDSGEPDDRAAAVALSEEASTRYKAAEEAGELKTYRNVFAPTPNRMFGPPSYVQGYVEEYLREWVLLLELGSRDSIGFPLGDGVIQFMIRPSDLAAGRFDRVKVVASGY